MNNETLRKHLGPYYDAVTAYIDHLRTMSWMDNHGVEPQGEDIKMYATRADARDAAWDVALDAAWDVVRGAALDAAWDVVRDAALDAARDAAWDVALDAALDAAMDATRDVSWNAAWDAALYAGICIICADLPIEQKHIDHIRRRWSVWEAGYGVLCDVDGVLYCYRRA